MVIENVVAHYVFLHHCSQELKANQRALTLVEMPASLVLANFAISINLPLFFPFPSATLLLTLSAGVVRAILRRIFLCVSHTDGDASKYEGKYLFSFLPSKQAAEQRLIPLGFVPSGELICK